MKIKYIAYSILLTSIFSCSIFLTENKQINDKNTDESTTTTTTTTNSDSTVVDNPDTTTIDNSENTNSINYETEELSSLISKAKNENKLILLMFGAEWCIPCKQYKEVTFKEKDTKAYLDAHYLVKYLDVETDFEGLELRPIYNIESFPTIVIFDSEKNELDRIIGHLMGYSFLRKITEVYDLNNN